MPPPASSCSTSVPASSAPTTPSRPACAPSAAALRATLAAPPRRASRFSMRTMGTGASGEMRLTSPNQ